jgi:hypothetical protein
MFWPLHESWPTNFRLTRSEEKSAPIDPGKPRTRQPGLKMPPGREIGISPEVREIFHANT